jgi:hypothetical protein
MITIYIQLFEDNMRYISSFVLPNGEWVNRKNEYVGFEKLIPYEGSTATVIFSDGTKKLVRIHDINADTFMYTVEGILK